jgi:hypothetical protein
VIRRFAVKPEIIDYMRDTDLRFITQLDILKEEAIFIAKGLKESYSELTETHNSSYDVKVEFSNSVSISTGNKYISRPYKFVFNIVTNKDKLDEVTINTVVKFGTRTVMKFDLKWYSKKRFSVEIHTEMHNYDEITEEIAMGYITRHYDYVLISNSPKISKSVTKLLDTHGVTVYTGVSESKFQRLLSKLSKKVNE